MNKAVFFDWFGTLAHYDPPREELQSQVLQELGFTISPADIQRAMLIADREFYERSATTSGRPRSAEEQAKLTARHQLTVLSQAGVDATDELAATTLARLRELSNEMSFVLYDDVLSVLRALKARRLTLGLLTNWLRDFSPVRRQLGLDPYIDFALTSKEAGAEKPQPAIFQYALRRAGVPSGAAVHVGDQYAVDVVGARGVGITPILLDRADIYPEVTDCHRIRGLSELTNYLS